MTSVLPPAQNDQLGSITDNLNNQLGSIPDNLKELLAATAKEYQWSPQKLANIEKGLRLQKWSPEQIAHVEKAIREDQWTPKEIVDIEKAYREKKLTGNFFANHPNPKLRKFGNPEAYIVVVIICDI